MTTSTILPALTAPSNAPSCPPEGSTSPGIARRAVLARTAAALGLGAAANVMAVVGTRAAPIPKIPLPTPIEVPELLALEPAIDRLEIELSTAIEQRAVARAAYDGMVPAVPDQLRLWTKEGPCLPYPMCQQCSEIEWNPDNNVVFDDIGRAKRVIRADNLRNHLPLYDGRSRTAREMKRLLRIAESYEAAVQTARERSGYDAASVALAEVQSAIFETYEQAYRARPVTMHGLLIVARAVKLTEEGDLLSSDAVLADHIIGVASRGVS